MNKINTKILWVWFGLSLSLYLEAGIFSKAIEALIKKRPISFTYFSFFHLKKKTFGHYCLFFHFSTGFLFDASVILKLNFGIFVFQPLDFVLMISRVRSRFSNVGLRPRRTFCFFFA